LRDQVWIEWAYVLVVRPERCGKTVRRAGKACLIAKGSRIPADWARHPWLAHFALQAGPSCPAGGGAVFFGIRSGLSAVDESGSARAGRKEQSSVGRQVRVGKTVRRAGKACLIAKGSRIPADWARHPWLAHFALQAGLTCTISDSACLQWRHHRAGALYKRRWSFSWL